MSGGSSVTSYFESHTKHSSPLPVSAALLRSVQGPERPGHLEAASPPYNHLSAVLHPGGSEACAGKGYSGSHGIEGLWTFGPMTGRFHFP